MLIFQGLGGDDLVLLPQTGYIIWLVIAVKTVVYWIEYPRIFLDLQPEYGHHGGERSLII